MNKGYLTVVLLTTLLCVLSNHKTLAQTQHKKIEFVNSENSLQEQAEGFATKLSEILSLDESQKNAMSQLRLMHLTELKKIQDDAILSLEEKRKEVDILQSDYDIEFSRLLTAEQRFIMRKEEIVMN